jgi:hypothetical protein
VKHAGKQALVNLEPLLESLRALPQLTERTPGSFYLGSSAFIHFHEDAAGLFADFKEDLSTFSRYEVSTTAHQRAVLARVEKCLANAKKVTKHG